jgi:nucleosome binding factor SPN SPT16 subunit
MASFVDAFRQRIERLYTKFTLDEEAGFGMADALVISTGVVEADDEAGYLRCYALMTWLTGSELQGAVLIMTKKTITLALAKADFPAFKSLAGDGPGACPKIAVLDASADGDTLKGVLKEAVSAESTVGLLVKEAKAQRGAVADAANAATDAAKEKVNVSVALARILAVKDADELAKIKKAARLSTAVFRYALLDRIEKTIDQEKKVSHSTLSQVAEDAIVNPAKVKVAGLKTDFCDPCYPPIIQSSSKETKDRTFDLKPSAESDDNPLASGVIICSLGARYSNFCSNISRTLLVDPTPEQKESYEAVLKAHSAAIDALSPGKKLSDAFNAAVESLKSSGVKNANALVSGLGKNVGFGTGIEYRDSAHILNAKNATVVEEGMVFNVAVGCSNLKDSQNGNYALMLADTVYVRGGSLKPDIFTASSRKDLSVVSYELADDEFAEENDVEEVVNKTNAGAESADAEEIRSRRRAAALGEGDLSLAKVEEERRRKHQLELEKRMLERGRARLEGIPSRKGGGGDEGKKKCLDEVVAYRSTAHFPPTKSRQLTIDMEAEALIVAINGVPVPFHISTIKNASKSDEGKHTYLRINFHVPQGAVPRSNFSRAAQNAPTFPDLEKRGEMTPAFVKELSFRSSNPQNLSDCLRRIKELVKRDQMRRVEAIEKQTLVTQEKVRLTKGGRVPFISDAVIRPALASGKNNRGTLEAHSNGFYYRGKQGSVEIVYANIRNAFYQEADRETIVCVHFHLKNDIVVGKKKTKDLQFYIEVMEAAVKLNDTRRRQFDQDELEEEQREREMRNRTNKLFLKFTKEVEERHGLEFDIPYRSLAFSGAPRSAAVTLLPTVNCIIDIIDWPPFVLNLHDVEIAHFERVNLQLRNFDLVFVFKSFQDDPTNASKPTKDMWQRISAIESEDLNSIKRYLDEQQIKYYESSMSLQWNNVLKTIRSDFEAFYDDGGWQVLSAEGHDKDEDASDEDSLEGDQEFEVPADASDEEYGSSDASSDESDSDVSGDMRAELEGDSDAGEDDLSSDEEGLDWEAAERKAKAEDAKRGDLSDDDGGGGARKRNTRKGGESRKRRH